MPVFTSIATAGAAALGLTGLGASLFIGVGAAALQVAAGFGLSFLASALMGSDTKTQETQTGVRLGLQAGDDVPRSFVMGLGATDGSLTYGNTWGMADDTPNAYVTQVIALSDLPVKGLAGVYVNGVQDTILEDAPTDWGKPLENFRTDDGKDHLWIKFYDGTQAAADPFLVGKFGSADRTYSASRVGFGVAYAIVTALVHEELFTGVPKLRFVLDGLRLYDVSRDSSAGGSGPQRWNNPATWGGDGDYLPAVQLYNLLRGLRYGGRWFYGLQRATGAQLPGWVAPINNCRLEVEAASGTEPQYRSGGEFFCSSKTIDPVRALLTTCQGRLASVSGDYVLRVGAPPAASMLLSDGDIVDDQAQTFTPFFGIDASINGITADFPSVVQGYNVTAAAPLYDDALEEEDGGRRLPAHVSFNLVTSPTQVARLMQSALREARRARRHTFTLPPRFGVLEPGQVIAWTSVRNGYVGKLMRVDGVMDLPDLNVTIDLTEVDPTDYDFDIDTDYTAPTEIAVVSGLPPVQQVKGFSVIAVNVTGNGNSERPAIRAFWDGTLAGIGSIKLTVRKDDGDVPVAEFRPNDFSRGVADLLSPGIIGLTAYEVQAEYEPLGDRPTIPTAWLPVTTLEARLGADDIYPIDLQQLNTEIKQFFTFMGSGLRAVLEDNLRDAITFVDQDFANYTDKKSVQQQLITEAGGIRSEYNEAILSAVGPGSAVAAKLERFEVAIPNTAYATVLSGIGVRVTNSEGTITSQGNAITQINNSLPNKADVTVTNALSSSITSINGQVSAQANAITELQGTVGYASGSARFRMNIGYNPASGWSSRIGMEARIGSANNWISSGLLLEATGSVSRILMVADQVIMTSNANNNNEYAKPFFFSFGVLYADSMIIREANIGDLTVTNLKVANLAIGTGKVQSNAISGHTFYSDNGGINVSNGLGWVDVASASYNPVGKAGSRLRVIFTCSVYANGNGSNNWGSFKAELLKNGNWYGDCVARPDDENQDGLFVIQTLDQSPSNATWTVRVTYIGSPGPGANIYCRNRFLAIEEYKA